MKTPELTTPESTREILGSLVADGHVLHGSPIRDLDLLIASETGFVHKDRDGNDIPNTPLVCGTTNLDYAIFFGAAHAVARNARNNDPVASLLRSSVISEYNSDGSFAREYYYASNALKDLIKAREAAGILGAVYWYPSRALTYQEDDREWVTSDSIRPLGSVSISVACLSFDFYALPHPNSNPTIRGYNAEAGVDISVDY